MEVIDEPVRQYQIAALPTRMLNYVIDQIIFLLMIMGLKNLGVAIKLENLQNESTQVLLYLLLINTLYYFFMELFTGKTIGKIITRTHVVDSEGEKPTLKAIVIRSLCRNIPFDNLSYLIMPQGWHDQISGTSVVHDSYTHSKQRNKRTI